MIPLDTVLDDLGIVIITIIFVKITFSWQKK